MSSKMNKILDPTSLTQSTLCTLSVGQKINTLSCPKSQFLSSRMKVEKK